jgi:hypothetical protein
MHVFKINLQLPYLNVLVLNVFVLVLNDQFVVFEVIAKAMDLLRWVSTTLNVVYWFSVTGKFNLRRRPLVGVILSNTAHLQRLIFVPERFLIFIISIVTLKII